MDPEILAVVRTLRIERNLSPYTVAAYLSDLRDVAGAFPSQQLRDLSWTELRGYLGVLQEKGLKGSTIRRRIASLRVFYGYLLAEGSIHESPMLRFRSTFASQKQIPRVMPISHVERLLTAARRSVKNLGQDALAEARTLRDLAILDTLFCTGIRSCEAIKLDVQDIDFERKTLHVKGKGRREREIYIANEEVLQNLRSCVSARPMFRPKESAVFLNSQGRRLHVQSVGIIFRRAQRHAGLTGFSPHCLRHTMATLLVENGADLRSAQEILGHSNIRTTEIYVAVSRTRQQAVMSRFNARNQLAIA